MKNSHNLKITGSLIQAYVICPRQAWLMSRNISGDQYNEFLTIGRLIDEESYNREKKEINIEQNKIDFIRISSGELLVVETKKSSKMIKASEAQLLHYLYSLRHKHPNIRGELRIPKEKKVIPIQLSEGAISFIEKLTREIKNMLSDQSSPDVVRITACKSCSYNEFCWS